MRPKFEPRFEHRARVFLNTDPLVRPLVFGHLMRCPRGGVGHFAHSPLPFLLSVSHLLSAVFSLLPFVSLHLDRTSHLIICPRSRGSRSHGTEKWCLVPTHLPSATRRSKGNSIPQCFTLNSEAIPAVGSSEPPEFLGHRLEPIDDPCASGGEHGRSGPHSPYGPSSGWWVIFPWRLGAVHDFTSTQAAGRNSGSEHEEAANAGLALLLLRSDFCL